MAWTEQQLKETAEEATCYRLLLQAWKEWGNPGADSSVWLPSSKPGGQHVVLNGPVAGRILQHGSCQSLNVDACKTYQAMVSD